MTASRARLAPLVWLLAVGCPVAILVLVLVSPTPELDAWAVPLYSLIVTSWGLTGAFLVTRRPDNRVGWVIWAAGVGIGLAIVGQLWAGLSYSMFGGSLPGTGAGAIVGLLFGPAFYLVMLVPLLFPDGRFMSRRWAAAGALLLLSAAATLVGSLVRPGEVEGMRGVENPLGLPALGGIPQALIDLGGFGALLCIVAGIVAVILRYRRGSPVERKQLKWFGSVAILAFSMFFVAAVAQPYGQVAWIAASLSMGLIPIAIGIAILRYRLYEIDRIVSRTLSYALVTALLAAAFVGTNLALQAVLVDATGGGTTLTTAASTLVVAALFQPVRRRIQAPIDRRFNRAGADAQRVVEAMSVTVRDEVDLERLRGSVVATASEAVRPAGAALWLRRPAG